MKKRQECIDHALWSKHLSIAYWTLIAIATAMGVFLGKPKEGILLVILALALFVASIVLDIRHVRWHVRIEEDENNYHFEP